MKLDIQVETSSEQMDTGYTHLEFWGIVFPGGWGEKNQHKNDTQHCREGKKLFSFFLSWFSAVACTTKDRLTREKQKFINMYISYIHDRDSSKE